MSDLTTNNFTIQTLTGQKIDYKLNGIEGVNVREKLNNALEKLLEMGIDLDNIKAMYYNNVAYIV